MNLGLPEIAIIVVIVVALFVVVKVIGDKRYFKRPGKTHTSTEGDHDRNQL